jgi:hypothetical protein
MNKNNLINIYSNPQPIPSVFNEGFSQYETVLYMIGLTNQLIENQNLGSDEIEDLKNKKLELERYLTEKTISDSRLVNLENLKLSILNYYDDISNNRKLSANGNFTGTWFGLEKPTLSDEGMRSTVEKINDVDLPLINSQLRNNNEQLIDYMQKFNNFKNDNAISPENFNGDDFEKIQQALDYAIEHDISIKFTKMYDITNKGSLLINKANGSWDNDRRILYLIGCGGGIIKNDGGAIFTATFQKIGDINVNALKFKSVAGAGTVVWDCDKLIRIKSNYCSYINVDTVVSATNQYAQSLRFEHENITGGNGWAFDFLKSYDTTISDNLIETRENGIRNTANIPNEINNKNLRIINNCIEALYGKCIELGGSFGTSFLHNYFEFCGEYVDLETLANNHQGLVFMNNGFNMKQEQIDSNMFPVLIGRTIREVNVDETNEIIQTCCFIGNVSNGNLYDKTGTGEIISIGDRYFPVSNANDNVVNLFGINRINPNVTGITDIRSGGIVRGFKHTSQLILPVGYKNVVNRNITIPYFKYPIKDEDIVTIQFLPCDNVRLNSYSVNQNGSNTSLVRLNIENTGTSEITCTLTITVMKIYN